MILFTACPLISAVLLWLSFIPEWGFPLAHVALIPLIHAMYACPHPFRAAWLFGGGFGALYCYWLKVFSPLAPLCLTVFFGFWACAALGPVIACRRQPFAIFAALWIMGWLCSDWLRSLGPYGFEWGRLGHSQYGFDALILLAGSAGATALSFVVLISNFLLYRAVTSAARVTKAAAVSWLIFLVAVSQLTIATRASFTDRSIRLILMQTSVNPYVSSDDRRAQVTAQIRLLADQIADSAADLMILPETLFPHSIQAGGELDADIRRQLSPMFGPGRLRLLVGSIETEDGGFYNAAQLFNSDGWLEAQYWKEHLVPFGEAVPVLDRLAPFRILGELLGTPFFKSGPVQPPPLAVRNSSGDTIRIGVLICFEGTFERLVRGRLASRPDILVNISNDAWSESDFGHDQHSRILKFRAVESGLPVIRVGNTRATGVYHPDARVDLIPHNTPAAQLVHLP